MNKKLVAVAVAGLLAAPLAAQAQNANVTLYGRLNIDFEIVNRSRQTGCHRDLGGEVKNSGRVLHRIVQRACIAHIADFELDEPGMLVAQPGDILIHASARKIIQQQDMFAR